MEITQKMSGSMLTLTIKEHVTGLQEVNAIVDIVKMNSGFSMLQLDMHDAFVIPSSLIGYLLKLINVDKKSVSIIAHQKELAELLSDLQLDTVFEVRRV